MPHARRDGIVDLVPWDDLRAALHADLEAWREAAGRQDDLDRFPALSATRLSVNCSGPAQHPSHVPCLAHTVAWRL